MPSLAAASFCCSIAALSWGNFRRNSGGKPTRGGSMNPCPTSPRAPGIPSGLDASTDQLPVEFNNSLSIVKFFDTPSSFPASVAQVNPRTCPRKTTNYQQEPPATDPERFEGNRTHSQSSRHDIHQARSTEFTVPSGEKLGTSSVKLSMEPALGQSPSSSESWLRSP